MKESAQGEGTGRFHEVKGTIKEKAGELTNDPDLEGEGIGEKIAGKIQKKIGQLEKASKNRESGIASSDRTSTTFRLRSGNRLRTGGRS